MVSEVKMRLLILLFLFTALIAPARSAFAQASTAPSAVSQPDIKQVQIRTLLGAFKERATGLEALEKLLAMRDPLVLRVFQRAERREIYLRDAVLVYIPKKDGPQLEVFDLFVDSDRQGVPIGAPLTAVPSDQIAAKDEIVIAPLVRRGMVNSLRVLGLKMDDPAIRLNAARDLGNKRQFDALPELRVIAEKDADSEVRHVAEESIALILAAGLDKTATPRQRMDAVRTLGEFHSLRSLDLLIEQSKTASADEKAVYATAIGQLERHKSFTNWIKNLFFGLSADSIFVLLALGLAITFGLMGVINMAHGEMLMIGAVTTWACCEYIGKSLPAAWFDWYYVIAFPLAFLVAASVGLIIELTVVRFLYKRALDSMLATIGVSYILIQGVRKWRGDNLGMRPPSWSSGNWEIIQDVVLSYNRLFLIALTVFCVVGIILLFRLTRLGLMIRATVQNREMAQVLGVNTRLVDMLTFSLGAGLAGIAGWGIVLTSTPSPEMGTTYIVKTFLTVVVGGVGKLAGVIASGLSLGFIEKLLEPIVVIESPIHLFNTTWSQVAALVLVILFMQRKPAGLFPDKGRMADQADKASAPMLSQTSRKTDLLLVSSLTFVGLFIIPALYATASISPESVNKIGYILTFAICAIGLDLIWGYIGVLSLCQFLFFSLGGYCMGLYLINHGPHTEGIPDCLYYVMSAVTKRTPPWFLPIFQTFPVTVIMGLLLPAMFAALIGITTFRSRVRGVYFAILTQAITVAAVLIFQDNDLKLGGTNGLTNFTHILGHPIVGAALPIRGETEEWFAFVRRYAPIAFAQTRFWLYAASFIVLVAALILTKMLISSGFGRVLVAIRDDETRLRFVGYQTWAYKTCAFALAAALGSIGGMLYVPQMGIINPGMLAAPASILVVAWVAIGGRGTLWGAVLGAIFVSLLYDRVTSWKPDYWLFVLGGLFVLVPLFFPGGLMSVPSVIRKAMTRRNRASGFTVMPPSSMPGGVAEGGAR